MILGRFPEIQSLTPEELAELRAELFLESSFARGAGMARRSDAIHRGMPRPSAICTTFNHTRRRIVIHAALDTRQEPASIRPRLGIRPSPGGILFNNHFHRTLT